MTSRPCSLPRCSSTRSCSHRGCWTPQVLHHASTKRLVAAAAAAKKQSGDKPRGSSSSSNQDTMSDADFEAMLADSTFMSGLRSKLVREMADEAAIPSNSSTRRGPFDSDEYDYAALEEAELAAAGDPADELATASAARLAAASDSIARKHKSRSGTSSADATSSSTASGPGRRQKQNAQGDAESAQLSSSNRSGSPTVTKRGNRVPSASAAGAGSISDIPPGLDVPLVVLKKYKSRLFEAGSPLVRQLMSTAGTVPWCVHCLHHSSWLTPLESLSCKLPKMLDKIASPGVAAATGVWRGRGLCDRPAPTFQR